MIVHEKYDDHAINVGEICKSQGLEVVFFLIDEYFSDSKINLSISNSEHRLVVNKNSIDLEGEHIRSIYARDLYFPNCPSEFELQEELIYEALAFHLL